MHSCLKFQHLGSTGRRIRNSNTAWDMWDWFKKKKEYILMPIIRSMSMNLYVYMLAISLSSIPIYSPMSRNFYLGEMNWKYGVNLKNFHSSGVCSNLLSDVAWVSSLHFLMLLFLSKVIIVAEWTLTPLLSPITYILLLFYGLSCGS